MIIQINLEDYSKAQSEKLLKALADVYADPANAATPAAAAAAPEAKKAEPKRRTKPKPQPEEAPEEAPEADDDPLAEEPGVTMKEAVALASGAISAGKVQGVKEALKDLGYTRVSQVKEKDLQAFVDAIKAL